MAGDTPSETPTGSLSWGLLSQGKWAPEPSDSPSTAHVSAIKLRGLAGCREITPPEETMPVQVHDSYESASQSAPCPEWIPSLVCPALGSPTLR